MRKLGNLTLTDLQPENVSFTVPGVLFAVVPGRSPQRRFDIFRVGLTMVDCADVIGKRPEKRDVRLLLKDHRAGRAPLYSTVVH